MRRSFVLSVLFVILESGAARAGVIETFAHFFQVDASTVDEARGFELPKGAAFTHVIVGRFPTTPGHRQHGAALMRCDAKQCTGDTVYLEVDAELSVLGVVDLGGAPTSLAVAAMPPSRSGHVFPPIARLGKGRALSVPALVLETRTSRQRTGSTRFRKEVTGVERRNHLVIVPLQVPKNVRPHPIFREPTVDRGISGAGTGTTYRLERGKSKRALDIVATEQRYLENDSMCLLPDPTEHRFILKEGRYQRDLGLDLPRGCR